MALKEELRAGVFGVSPVGVLALDVSSGNPAMLLRLEELLYGLWLLEEAVRWDTKDTLSGEWRAAEELESCLFIG